MSDTAATTTGVVGLGLATASGIVIFGVAEYGPGIGPRVLTTFAAFTVVVGALGWWIDELEWSVALPLGLVAVALAAIWALSLPDPLPGLSMHGFVGLLLSGMGVASLLSLPLARRARAARTRTRAR